MTRITRPTRKRREVTPPAQVVRPPFFVNENKFFAPLVQVTPSTERQLADDLTANEAKAMLVATPTRWSIAARSRYCPMSKRG